MKRWAKSYSIVDHELLHGGYLGQLSHQALALYLFYVVVADGQGRSYYAAKTICRILRLKPAEFICAQRQLQDCGLIYVCGPNVWVNNLESRNDSNIVRTCASGEISQRRGTADIPPDRQTARNLPLHLLEDVLRKVAVQRREKNKSS
jgi:hypothetical protein